MDFEKLNEELEEFLEALQLQEMTIYYGTDHGVVNNVIDAFKRLNIEKEGMYHVNQFLTVEKEVTQEEINKNLYKPIQKGVYTIRKYPIIIVWGEQDKYRENKKLEGHGLSHILKGHGKDTAQAFKS